MGIELVRFASRFTALANACRITPADQAAIDKALKQLKDGLPSFYKDYSPLIDKDLAPFLLGEYRDKAPEAYKPAIFAKIAADGKFRGDLGKYADYLFANSFLVSEKETMAFLEGFKPKNIRKLQEDPAFVLAVSFADAGRKAQNDIGLLRTRLDSLQRIYMKGQLEMSAGKTFYPDANSTLRVSYGSVRAYRPADGVNYNYFTTLDGLVAKEDPEVYDYEVLPRIKELQAKKDYGRYADSDGSLHTCFIANNHTSGGNSGSPVFDADGYLIGLNFDRCWEGTMSDIAYDPNICRNIILDIRYCLWVIDTYAGAGHLVKEMSVVQ